MSNVKTIYNSPETTVYVMNCENVMAASGLTVNNPFGGNNEQIW